MPIYEYQCDECQTEFQELVMSRAAEREVACAKCGSPNVTKLLSGSAVHSGSGSGSGASMPAPGPRMGGCGGGCSCH